MTKKGRVGFRTPHTDLQDNFEEIRRILSAKKDKWKKIKKISIKGRTMFKKEYDEIAESQDVDIDTRKFFNETRNLLIIIELISSLGIDISETHERLTKVENAIEQLKLRTK